MKRRNAWTNLLRIGRCAACVAPIRVGLLLFFVSAPSVAQDNGTEITSQAVPSPNSSQPDSPQPDSPQQNTSPGSAKPGDGNRPDTKPPAPKWAWTVAPATIHQRNWLPTSGPLTATLEFEPAIFGNAHFALECDGRRQAALVSDELRAVELPTKKISLEAWVLIERTTPWGGFISALQDNGDHERGTLLGLRGPRLCFAVATQKTGRLTYLTAPNDFTLGRWHHVVGTYDGESMRLYVDGQVVATSTEPQGDIWLPANGVLALGAYRDDNEFYRLQGALHSLAIYDRVLSSAAVEQHYDQLRGELPQPPQSEATAALLPDVYGPFVTANDDQTWSIEWQSDDACNGWIEIGPTKYDLRRVDEPTTDTTTEHRVLIQDLPHDRVHSFRVGGTDDRGQAYQTRIYRLDTMLRYPPPVEVGSDSTGAASNSQASKREGAGSVRDITALAEQRAALADFVIRTGQVTKGYAFIIDGNGDLAIELARRSRLQIVVVQPDPTVAKMAREKLHDAKMYGTRVTVQLRRFDRMNYGPFLANYVITDPSRWGQHGSRTDFKNLYAILKPSGGTLIAGARPGNGWAEPVAKKWSTNELSLNDRTDWVEEDIGHFLVVRRGSLPGASDWTHQYGKADNTSCSQDDLIRGDLSVLWWGRPGPRPMPDRGPRNPAPVSANGRLYIQGNRTLFGLDSHNGAILWFHQIPTMRRANIPRDGSNMVATDDFLYLAMQGHCIGFHGQTGDRRLTFSVPGDRPGNQRRFDWGIVACQGDLLFGSAVRRNSHYVGDLGEWFEDAGVANVAKVTSNRLFALDRHTGQVVWQYDRGRIVNSTFSVDDQSVYFLESRNPDATLSTKGRLLGELRPDQYLVGLDHETGNVLWEKSVDLSHCEFMTYMSVADDTLIVAGTDNDKVFHTHAFSAINGNPIWQHATPTRKRHHSGHLSHPLVVGDRIFVNKHILDRNTGKVIKEDKDFDWHGCGVTSASNHTLFRRYEYHGMMDLETGQRTEFLGVRSGCWLSLIPSGGTVLAPETSAGCSCTHAVQTTLAYVPRYLLPTHDNEQSDDK